MSVHPTDTDYAAARAIMLASQMTRLEKSEQALEAAGVPRHFWLYVVGNCDPAIEPIEANRGGTWHHDRAWILGEIESQRAVVWRSRQDEMHYVAVDGRDPANIRHYIEACWQSYDMESAWRDWLVTATSQQ